MVILLICGQKIQNTTNPTAHATAILGSHFLNAASVLSYASILPTFEVRGRGPKTPHRKTVTRERLRISRRRPCRP